MVKKDFKKDFKEFYSFNMKGNQFVTLPKFQFLTIVGEGDPNTSKDFSAAVSTLFPLAYTLKFMCKQRFEIDYSVMPLEGLWWSDDMDAFLAGRKEKWKWKLLILQPELITSELFAEAVSAVKSKKKYLVAPNSVQLEYIEEGMSVQVSYQGPYADETETIKQLHAFAKENNYELRGEHHEIYLNDARRVSPDKLKIIIRQPIKPAR